VIGPDDLRDGNFRLFQDGRDAVMDAHTEMRHSCVITDTPDSRSPNPLKSRLCDPTPKAVFSQYPDCPCSHAAGWI
jgi:hypothetical protein